MPKYLAVRQQMKRLFLQKSVPLAKGNVALRASKLNGEMAEWFNAAALKTAVDNSTGGSNPSFSSTYPLHSSALSYGFKK